mmetsp:Transcript_18309/g.55263  ORF Transcript_18309/g.55263 Transcript_18309/m.55263 type:complete len:304 (+) Transcript_18309:793-1704(+)
MWCSHAGLQGTIRVELQAVCLGSPPRVCEPHRVARVRQEARRVPRQLAAMSSVTSYESWTRAMHQRLEIRREQVVRRRQVSQATLTSKERLQFIFMTPLVVGCTTKERACHADSVLSRHVIIVLVPRTLLRLLARPVARRGDCRLGARRLGGGALGALGARRAVRGVEHVAPLASCAARFAELIMSVADHSLILFQLFSIGIGASGDSGGGHLTARTRRGRILRFAGAGATGERIREVVRRLQWLGRALARTGGRRIGVYASGLESLLELNLTACTMHEPRGAPNAVKHPACGHERTLLLERL